MKFTLKSVQKIVYTAGLFIGFSCNLYAAACPSVENEFSKLQKWITPALHSDSSIGCPAMTTGSPLNNLELIMRNDKVCGISSAAALLVFYNLFENNPNYKMCGFEIKKIAIIAETATDGKICSNLPSEKLESCFIDTMAYYTALKQHGDLDLAFLLTKKTANSNDVTGYSQMFLGYMYSFGEGTNKDALSAIKWFKIALEKIEDKEFRINILLGLSVAYEDSNDYQNAILYARQCASMGNEYCKKGLNRLLKKSLEMHGTHQPTS